MEDGREVVISVRKTKALLPAVLVLLVLATISPVSAQEEPAGSAQYPEEGGAAPARYGDQPISPEETQHRPDAEGVEEDTPPVSPDGCDLDYGGCPVYDDDGCFVYPDGTRGCDVTDDFAGDATGDVRQTTDVLNPHGYPQGDTKLPPEDECDPPQEECSDGVTATFAGDATDDARQTTDTLNGAEEGAPAPADEPPAVPETPSAAPLAAPPAAPPADGSKQYSTDRAPIEPEAPASVGEYQYAADPVPQRATVTPLPAVTPELDALREDAHEGEQQVEEDEWVSGESEAGRERAAAAPREDTAGREETRAPRQAERTIEKRELGDQQPTVSTGGKSTLYTLGGSFLLIAGVALAGRFLKR